MTRLPARTPRRAAMAAAVALGLLAAPACDRKSDLEHERGAPPPPPPASASAGACQAGGGKPGDTVTAQFFPAKVQGFCVDPNGETRAYGADAPDGIDQVCLQQFDGDCEVYKSFGLERVVTLRYVDGGGSEGVVDAVLSRFASAEGAYGFFTRRLVGNADPAQAAPGALTAGGAAALGSGSASVWRAKYVAELYYINPDEPPERAIALGRAVLTPLAKQIGDRLTGELALPAAARALPAEHRVPFGVAYELRDLLGVAGTGAGAFGFYRDGKQRWRVLSIERPDEAGAKDVMESLKRALDGKWEKGTLPPAMQVSVSVEGGGPKLGWMFARSGSRVFGVGDEEYALGADATAETVAEVCLDRAQKLEKLRQLVQGPAPTGGKAAGPKADGG